jgi:hypothetical protein
MAKKKNVDYLKEISGHLFKNKGFWQWSTITDEGTDQAWFVRTPRDDLKTETWLEQESILLIHACNPDKIMEAVRGRNKEMLADSCSYCDENYNCGTCGETPTDKVRRKVKVISSLTAMSKKV